MPEVLTWQSLTWTVPLDLSAAAQVLRARATDPRAPRVVFEAWGRAGAVSYRVGAARDVLGRVGAELAAGVLHDRPLMRPSLAVAGEVLTPGGRTTSLSLARAEQTSYALVSSLSRARGGEQLVVQLVLGRPRRPRRAPPRSTSTGAFLRGRSPTPATSDVRRELRDKLGEHAFQCAVRIGADSPSPARARSLLVDVLSALRTLEAPGVRLRLRRLRPERLMAARAPWLWPLHLTVEELAVMSGWPLGPGRFPGLPALHPRRLLVMGATPATGRIIGDGEGLNGQPRPLALSPAASLQHVWAIGPTGTGKSTLLGNLAGQDMAAGRGLVVIDPKGDLVAELLQRVPPGRREDVVILDPTDNTPVGLNPLAGSGRSAETRADGVLAVFAGLYGDAWGPRTSDILHACLLTLTRSPSPASLVMVPLLLTNPGFRRSLTARVVRDDPLGLGSFWAWYEGTSEAERATAIAPLMNKLRSVLLRPGLRAVLGQREPRFEINEIFTARRILLVNLAKGVLGEAAAGLLGSLVIAQLWQTTLARASVDPARRFPVMVYVDEVQDYLHLPTDLGDALAQARGLGVGFTLAHQFLAQLPVGMRAVVLANARSRVCFQLPHDDAVVLARGHAELAPEDFTALGTHEVYASLLSDGQVQPYAFGRTRPPAPSCSSPADLRAVSRQRYGRALSEVEAEWAVLAEGPAMSDPLGRRPRRRHDQ